MAGWNCNHFYYCIHKQALQKTHMASYINFYIVYLSCYAVPFELCNFKKYFENACVVAEGSFDIKGI